MGTEFVRPLTSPISIDLAPGVHLRSAPPVTSVVGKFYVSQEMIHGATSVSKYLTSRGGWSEAATMDCYFSSIEEAQDAYKRLIAG